MSEVANYLSEDPLLEVHLVLFSVGRPFFPVSPLVTIHTPDSDRGGVLPRKLRLGRYLREILRGLEPYAVLSFGSMYNSFVLLFSLGLGTRVYVSDRSNPYRNTELRFRRDPIRRHDGVWHYVLRRLLYPLAAGILVQTEKALAIEQAFSGHHNVVLFPNPIRELVLAPAVKEEKWVLNVGRFIETKNQLALVEVFSDVRAPGWKLVFAGDGPTMGKVRRRVAELGLADVVVFLGNVPDVDSYLQRSKIFAFMSSSEGFPNALAEAMKASLACLAYDCVAGPSDLIRDGHNGFLVPVGDTALYRERLEELMENDELRKQFQRSAAEDLDRFKRDVVLDQLKKELVGT